MLAFPNVVHFFANEFSGLRAGRLAFPRILAGSLQCFLFGHVYLLGEAVQFTFRIGLLRFLTVTDLGMKYPSSAGSILPN
ncbi:MAG TPA: hypothetical protein VMH05_08260 [Bryobacteraceae bacterium]|nr:hypothetical protein [Bryobacteraceae bacterium]